MARSIIEPKLFATKPVEIKSLRSRRMNKGERE
jgi:hypothetical protein